MAGFAFGIENSAGFGERLFAWGGLWTRSLDENLDEMLENQEPLRCGGAPAGEGGFSSELDLVNEGRVGVTCFVEADRPSAGEGEFAEGSFVVVVAGSVSAEADGFGEPLAG